MEDVWVCVVRDNIFVSMSSLSVGVLRFSITELLWKVNNYKDSLSFCCATCYWGSQLLSENEARNVLERRKGSCLGASCYAVFGMLITLVQWNCSRTLSLCLNDFVCVCVAAGANDSDWSSKVYRVLTREPLKKQLFICYRQRQEPSMSFTARETWQ